MLQSLYAGVSGLINHQRSMDVIGNNISNVNTVGYKKSQAGFADIMSMNIGGASVNPMQVGLGTRVNSTNLIFSQGGIEATNKATDLAISGRGFFVVSNGVMDYYSRNGNFTFNKEGKLVTPEGLVAQGRLSRQDQYGDFFIDQTGEIVDIQIPVGVKSPARATTNVELGGNLNSVARGTIIETPELRTLVGGTNKVSDLYNQSGVHLSLLDDQPVIYKSHGTAITDLAKLYNSGDEALAVRDGNTFKITLTVEGAASPPPLTLTYRATASREYSDRAIPKDLDPKSREFSTLGGLIEKIKAEYGTYIESINIVEGKLVMKAANAISSFSVDSADVPSNSRFNNILSGIEGAYATGDVKSSGEFYFQQRYIQGEDFTSVAELAGRLEAAARNVSESAKVYLGDISEFGFSEDGNRDRISITVNAGGYPIIHEYYYSTSKDPKTFNTQSGEGGGSDNKAKPFSTLDELIQAINSDFAAGSNTVRLGANELIGSSGGTYTHLFSNSDNNAKARLAEPLPIGTTITFPATSPFGLTEIKIRDGAKENDGSYRELVLSAGSTVVVQPNGIVLVNGDPRNFNFGKGIELQQGLQISNPVEVYYAAAGTTDGTVGINGFDMIRASNDGGRLRFDNISGIELKDVQVSYSGTRVGNDKRFNELVDDLNGTYSVGADPKISDPIGGKIVYDNNNDGGFGLKAMGFKDVRDSLTVLLSSNGSLVPPATATFVYLPVGTKAPEGHSLGGSGAAFFSSLDELLALIQEAQIERGVPAGDRIQYSITTDGQLNYALATASGTLRPDTDARDMFGVTSAANTFTFGNGNPITINFRVNLAGQTGTASGTITLGTYTVPPTDPMAYVARQLEEQINVTGFKVEWTGKDFLFKNPTNGGITKIQLAFNSGGAPAIDRAMNALFAPVNNATFSQGVQARTFQIGLTSPINYTGNNITNRHLLNEVGALSAIDSNTAATSGILRANFGHSITGAEIISSPALETALNLANTIQVGSAATSQRLLTIAQASDKLANLFNSTGASLGLSTNDKISLSANINGTIQSRDMIVSNNLGYPSDTTLGDLIKELNNTLDLKNPTGAYVNSKGSIVINGDDGENYSILNLSLRSSGRDQFNSLSNFTVLQQASGGYHSTTIPVIDSEGHEHSVVIEFEKDSDPRNVNQWKWKAVIPRPAQITGGAGSSMLPSGVVTFTPDGGLGVVVGSPINIVPNNGANPMEIRLDFGTIGGGFDGFTQYASKSITTKQRQNGYKEGSLEDYVIDDRGVISGLFSNGQSRQLAQIVMADFTNPQGLQKVGSSLYAANNSSGKPTITEPGEGGLGFVVSSSLEMSNVDLSMEITQMITIERGFQANSKIITTSDAMIQELLAMKR